MKVTLRYYLFYSCVSLCLLTVSGCKTHEQVTFKTPVDTTDKVIVNQVKQTFELKDLGVYVSNEFDGARLNGFNKLNDSTGQLSVYPENEPINNSAYYAFKAWSKESRPFYFTFHYPKGYKHRYLPKLKINDKWVIMDSSQVFKKDSIVTVKVQLSADPIIIAAQEIETSGDVNNWVTNLIKDKESIVSYTTFGKSRLGKNLKVLNISKGDVKNKDVIILLTRQHPPEVTGYYAFQNFLKTILENSELSDEFLSKYHVIAFPLMNPDGVDSGHWRHNMGGVDLNRDWSVYNQPEIKQTVSYINKTLKKNNSKLILGLDFHSTFHDVFYTNVTRDGTTLPNFISEWFNGIEDNIPGYKVNEDSANSDKPVSKGWFLYGHNAVGITYEIGDATSKDDIQKVGSVSAIQMMTILIQTNKPIN